MKQTALLALLAALALCVACNPQGEANMPDAPVAKIQPKELVMHGDTRIDNYFWLRERENPEVISYLEAENAFTKAVMKDTEELQKKLFDEMVGRLQQNDESVPYLDNGYYYYTRFVEGGQYAIYCRKEGSLEAEEEIFLDVNKLAEGHNFFSARVGGISPNNEIVAYSYDTVGRRKYNLAFKNLKTGEELEDKIAVVTGNMVWAADSKTIFYTRQDEQTLRSYRIYKHVIGSDPADDPIVYEEKDDTFSVRVGKTKSRDYIIIYSTQTMATEARFIRADQPDAEFSLVQPRERGLEYSLDHFGDHFYIRTNLNAQNFALMKTPVTKTSKENWEVVIPNRDDVFFQGFEVFKNHLVVSERQDGLRKVRVMKWGEDEGYYLNFDEPAYTTGIDVNLEFDTDMLRYNYTSMTTPYSVFEMNMNNPEEKTLLKESAVLGGYEKENYVTDRLFAVARDGVKVPVSIVYKKDIDREKAHPMLLYAYGSYGSSMDPRFDAGRISLLDRGFYYAVAHIRGGQEMGRHWYEDGKLLNKINTFTDFVDCSKYLIEEGYTSEEMLFAEGGSAGGLLMGSIANMNPELYKGILAHVPWVDVVTTMLDDTIPLTTSEYDEWGNPNDEEYYKYMLSYSPYDNVEAKAYPNMLVTTGLHDSQVQYWEPAKWVAKLRAMKTDNNILILKTNMEAGHGGATGRFNRYKERAFNYAFMLKLLDMNE